MTTHSETSELNLSAPVPPEGETWVWNFDGIPRRILLTAESPHAEVPEDIVTVALDMQRQLLIDAGYCQWFGPVEQSPVNCCADVAPTQGMKSPPPGSVDKILESLRAQLAGLRSDDAEVRPGGWRSIAQAREDAALCEERAAKAWEEVERLEQQARDVELAIERLS